MKLRENSSVCFPFFFSWGCRKETDMIYVSATEDVHLLINMLISVIVSFCFPSFRDKRKGLGGDAISIRKWSLFSGNRRPARRRREGRRGGRGRRLCENERVYRHFELNFVIVVYHRLVISNKFRLYSGVFPSFRRLGFFPSSSSPRASFRECCGNILVGGVFH